MTRNTFKGILVILLGGAFSGGLGLMYNACHPRAVPTHVEADELRYLAPYYAGMNCIHGNHIWRQRPDGMCYSADEPTTPAAQPSDVIEECVIADPKTYTFHTIDCAQLVGSIAWRKQHGLYPTPVPAAQPDCTILKSGAMECCGGPGHPPCDNGPGPIQGQWMAERGDHCTINGYTDVLCDNPCDTTGISLKEWETYSCTVDAGNGHISSGTLSPPHAGPTYGQWLTPEQMRAVPPPADEQSSGTVNYSDGGDFMYCKKQGDHWHCEPFYPPAVLKGPPTQVCVYDFVGSPYLRLNKAVSDPSCADFDSPPPAVINVPGDCLQYDATNNVFEACPPPDDNSEELEEDDDYNNGITDGRQI